MVVEEGQPLMMQLHLYLLLLVEEEILELPLGEEGVRKEAKARSPSLQKEPQESSWVQLLWEQQHLRP